MTSALVPKTVKLPAIVGDLEAYVRTVNGIAMLDAEEERRLARRLRRDNNLEAARQLVTSHLRFVVHIARGYIGYGLPLGDLIQEGNIGLMKAVRRFDPAHGVRLVSFAVHWIRAEIHEFILRNWRIVKIATTKAQRKLFFNLRSSKKRLGWLNQEEINTVARDLGVNTETVLEMESRLSGQDLPFDPAAESDDTDERDGRAPAHYLQDVRNDPARQLEQQDWDEQSRRRLTKALALLDPRSRDIVKRRWLDEHKPTLQELALNYGISAERIRQLENNAFQKLKASIAIT